MFIESIIGKGAIIVMLLTTLSARSQIQNGSFENVGGSDLSFWESTCGAYGFNSAPTGGGNWCIQVYSGNWQGCIPGYAYQRISGIQSLDSYILTGWAYSETVPYVGLYFGTINNNVITLQAGDTTTATSWTPLSVTSSFNLNPGDTAIVVLYGGSLGGPAQGFGYFDLIDLQLTTGLSLIQSEISLNIYPNPTSGGLTIDLGDQYNNIILRQFNMLGQLIKEEQLQSGQMIETTIDGAPGAYQLEILIGDERKARVSVLKE